MMIMEQLSNTYNLANIDDTNVDYDCYRTMINKYREVCGEIDEFVLSLLSIFIKACNSDFAQQDILDGITYICTNANA